MSGVLEDVPEWLRTKSEAYARKKRFPKQKNTNPTDFFFLKDDEGEPVLGGKGTIFALVLYIIEHAKIYAKTTDLLWALHERYPEEFGQKRWLHLRKGDTPANESKAKRYKFYDYVLCGSDGLSRAYEPFVEDIEDLLIDEIVVKQFPEFPKSDVQSALKAALHRGHTTLHDAVKALIDVVATLHERPAHRSYIDGSLSGIIYGNASGSFDRETKGHFDDLIEYLQAPPGDEIICLSGSPFSGRTSLVRTAFSSLGTTLDGSCHGLKVDGDEAGIKRLPVCALNCRRRTYAEIVASVGQFLDIPTTDPVGPSVSLEDQLLRLRRYASKRDAVYIFTNLDLSTDASERQIRGMGMMRLLKILSKASPENRIVVTNAVPMSPKIEQSPIRVQNLALKDRKFEDLTTFFQAVPSISKVVENAFNRHAHLADIPVSGALLSFLTSGIRIVANAFAAETGDEKFTRSVDKLVAQMSSFLTAVTERAADRDDLEIEFCAAVWDEIKPHIKAMDENLEWVLPLIAASDDGLSRASLITMFLEYEDCETVYDSERYAALIAALDTLGSVTGNRLVFKSIASVADSLEVAPSELTSGLADIETSGSAKTAEVPGPDDVDSTIDFRVLYTIESRAATGLLRAVQKGDRRSVRDARPEQDADAVANRAAPRTMYAETYRRIARLARKRSSLVKLQMEGIYGRRKGDLRRDLLAYVALLASLDRNAIETQSYSEDRSRLAITELEVFADSRHPRRGDGLQDIERLRFAYFALFQRDIDRDYRLTMRLDEDALRLNLLMQLFFGVGMRRRGPTFHDTSLDSSFPPHLKAAFDTVTLADIATSIGVSAFYADNAQRLYEAVDLGNDLLESVASADDSNREAGAPIQYDAVLAALSRLWEAELDGLFQGYVRPKYPSGDCWAMLERRIQELREMYQADAQRPSADPAFLAILSLHELRLGHARGTAENLQTKVEALLDNAVTLYGDRRVQDFGLSGRSARRLIKMLLGDVGVFVGEPPPSPEDIHTARNLLQLNIGRLSHFKGGDRVGVLTDCALVSAAQGELYDAVHFSESACDEIAYSSISRSLHADRLWNNIVCIAAKLQRPGALSPSADEDWTKLMSDLDELIALCGHTFIHQFVLAHTLRRQLMVCQASRMTSEDEKAWSLAKYRAEKLEAPRLMQVQARIDSRGSAA